jgi:hypothetical protein
VVVKPEDVRVFGANAALLLAQIEYWLKRPNARCVVEREGRTFVAKHRLCWSTETGLSAKQVRTALECLRASGRIHVERHLHENRVCGFVASTERVVGNDTAMAEMGHSVLDREGHNEEARTGHMDLDQSGQNYMDRDCIKIEERIGVAIATHLTPGEISDIVSPEGKEPMARRPKSVIGVSVRELAEKKVEPLATPLEQVVRPGQLAMVFKHAWADSYQDFLTPFTAT